MEEEPGDSELARSPRPCPGVSQEAVRAHVSVLQVDRYTRHFRDPDSTQETCLQALRRPETLSSPPLPFSPREGWHLTGSFAGWGSSEGAPGVRSRQMGGTILRRLAHTGLPQGPAGTPAEAGGQKALEQDAGACPASCSDRSLPQSRQRDVKKRQVLHPGLAHGTCGFSLVCNLFLTPRSSVLPLYLLFQNLRI